MTFLAKIAERFSSGNSKGENPSKSWSGSQQYELEHAIGFMQSDMYRRQHQDLISGRMTMSNGYFNELILGEFFENSKVELGEFVEHVRGRSVLDIGPCVMSPLATWDVASERIAIEPLFPPIEDWQKKNLGGSAYEGMTVFSEPAEKLLLPLTGKIDGAILCRNMLDHTPRWPFVLSNIAAYAAKGCRLLLWTDLDHGGEADDGHYDITPDEAAFRRLVIQLGFSIVREYRHEDRIEKNWGCFAIKMT